MQDFQESLKEHVDEYKIHPRIDAVLIALFVCSAIFITTFFIYLRGVNAQKGEIREGMLRTGNVIAITLIDPELHKRFLLQSQKTSPEYLKAVQPFKDIQAVDDSIRYLWTATMKNKKIYFILDPVPPTSPDAVKIMEEYKDASPDLYRAFAEKRPVVSEKPFTDPWGTWITAYIPIWDKNKEVIGVLGVTVDVKNYLARLKPIHDATVRALVTGLSLSLLMGLGTWFMRRFAVEINMSRVRIMEKLRVTVVTDGLTGLFNRRYFDVCYTSLFKESREKDNPLAVIMADVDHFKQVNDTYGHVSGDELLQQIARRLTQNIRLTDMVARYGGEEFVVLLPKTALDEAKSIAERIRKAIEDTPFKISADDGELTKTASLGIAILRKDDTMQSLLKRVDDGLYIAKKGGRNQVGIAD